ncbi:carbohydrate ABC transporter permease [Martelella radicis]|uniref:Alpha-1,4-digalacturonate transport system permease protein n=1 Tax=Martelella radicis TaxID=1397476 RepID=A0A7W6KLX7_9HYPH|nr:sugar ABC transporter permease [Martelella radicis]MBB4123734.1 alpha-1,4-digalacturonate transport system permease protein [Martelella radicis]
MTNLRALPGMTFSWLVRLLEVPFDLIERLIGGRRMPWAFLAPNMVIFGIFSFLPIALLIGYAFTGGSDVLLGDRPFVGLENFARLFDCENYLSPYTCRESFFWIAVRNTLWYVTIKVTAMLAISLMTAIILNRIWFGRGFFRAVFFYPVLLSPVVVGLVWQWFLNTNGLLNAFLVELGFERVIFMLDIFWSRFFVIFVSIWFQMGFYTLILLAGLQAIPSDIYEAAAIDGTPRWRVFTRITLPMLAPNLVVVLVLLMIRAVQVFDEAYVLTNGGGPGTANTFLVQFIYETAFASDLKLYGLASAASVVMGFVLLILTLVQLQLARKAE